MNFKNFFNKCPHEIKVNGALKAFEKITRGLSVIEISDTDKLQMGAGYLGEDEFGITWFKNEEPITDTVTMDEETFHIVWPLVQESIKESGMFESED